MPADYYSAPVSEVKPIFPRWVPFGCGGVAIAFLIVLFAGGAFLAGGGMGQFMDFVLGSTASEMRGMYTAGVTKPQRETLDRELANLRKLVREDKLSADRLPPVLREMQSAISDRTVKPEEVDKLTKAIRDAAR